MARPGRDRCAGLHHCWLLGLSLDWASTSLIVIGSLLLTPVGIGVLILMFAFARAFRDAAAAGRAGEQTPYAVRAATRA